MASASGPAGRPTPSLVRGPNALSSSDRAAGERHEYHMPAAMVSATVPRIRMAVATVLTVV
jgi:hypothetical protein